MRVVTLCGAALLSSCRREAVADVLPVGASVQAPAGAPAPSAPPSQTRPTVAPTAPPTDEDRTTVLDRDAAWRPLAPGLTARRALVRLGDGSVSEWRVLRLDLREISLTVRAARATERVSEAAQDPAALASVDGGFFDPAHRPSGVLVSEGAEIAPWNPGAGSGLLVVREQRASVLAGASAFSRPGTELAVQCGPRLIEQGGLVGIYRDDGQRWARTAACVRDEGRTLDLATAWLPADPLRGPGLLSFARALARREPFDDPRGCEVALNLDGGPSTGLWVRGRAELTHEAVGPTPWLLVARARPSLLRPPNGARR